MRPRRAGAGASCAGPGCARRQEETPSRAPCAPSPVSTRSRGPQHPLPPQHPQHLQHPQHPLPLSARTPRAPHAPRGGWEAAVPFTLPSLGVSIPGGSFGATIHPRGGPRYPKRPRGQQHVWGCCRRWRGVPGRWLSRCPRRCAGAGAGRAAGRAVAGAARGAAGRALGGPGLPALPAQEPRVHPQDQGGCGRAAARGGELLAPRGRR